MKVLGAKSKPLRYWQIWFGIAYDLMFACVLVALTTYVTRNTSDLFLRIGAVALYAVAAISAAHAIWKIRYRHIIAIDFLLDQEGIRRAGAIEDPVVPWGGISRGEYLPTILMYRLWVADSPQPIIVPVGRGWLPNGALNRRANLAIQYVTEGIGNRLETRWLPW
jgi:hypothetical protein